MDATKADRLNELFEKMVAERASKSECIELADLYSEFINDGREYQYPKNVVSQRRIQAH